MKVYNFQQNTPEWYAVRLGKLTASKAQAIGTLSKGLETLCWEKAAEILTGKLPEQIESEDIKRGHELEDEARIMYTLETGNVVGQVGFVEYSEYAGASPDGLVGVDGLIEIKCKNAVNHLKMLAERRPDSQYMWQMQMQMLVTGRKWCDFVSYNKDFGDKSLIIVRVEADEHLQERLKQGIEQGTKRIKEILTDVERGNI